MTGQTQQMNTIVHGQAGSPNAEMRGMTVKDEQQRAFQMFGFWNK